MLTNIDEKTMHRLQSLFDDVVKQKRPTYNEVDKFLNDVLVYGGMVEHFNIIG